MAAAMARQADPPADRVPRWVPILVESHRSGDGQPMLPRRHEPDLAGLAAFTLDPGGRGGCWEVAAGRGWTATVAGGSLGEGRFAVRWEPIAGPGGTVLVVVQRAWPQQAPSWLSEAAARIGSSLDLPPTAAEVVDAAGPWFADAAVIYALERLPAADELASPRAGHGAAVRRL